MKTMTVQAKMFAVFWCLLALEHGAVGSLTLEATPTTISPGLTDVLTINCTFTYDNLPDVATIMSIIISKAEVENDQSQNFQELVSLTSFASDHVSLLVPLNASIDGHAGTEEDSFLHLQWTFPTEAEKGVYRCDANVLDNTGHPMDMSTTVEVTSHQPDLQELIEKVNDLQTQLNSQGDKQSELENLVKNQSDTIVALQSQLTREKEENVALQSQLHQQNDTIVALQSQLDQQNHTTVTLQVQVNHLWTLWFAQLSSDFHISSEFNGRYYLLSIQDMVNASLSETICESHGGYLAEIDDVAENQFVVNFVDQFTTVLYVMLGATDEAQEGQWRFRYSGQLMTYSNWFSGEPDYPYNDCISILRSAQWQMLDWSCTSTGSQVKFLCEVPII